MSDGTIEAPTRTGEKEKGPTASSAPSTTASAPARLRAVRRFTGRRFTGAGESTDYCLLLRSRIWRYEPESGHGRDDFRGWRHSGQWGSMPAGASFWEVCHFRAFRSCGEGEVFGAGGVVAGEVVLVAVAVLVVPNVVVEVAVDADGAELEDDLGAVGGPSGPGNSESVFDDEAAGALDHAGGDRPSPPGCLVVPHVLVVVREVGDGPVHVGEAGVAGAGVSAGSRRGGGEGGGDCLRAAVQDAQQLPAGPLAGGDRGTRVQRGGGLAEVAADVDVIDEDRDLQAAGPRVVADGGDLLLVPVDEEDALADPLRVAAVGLVIGRADHVLDAVGDRGGHPLVPRLRAGVRLAAGGRGRDVLRLADGGGEVGDGDDLGHLLDARVRRTGPAALAVLRAQGDALAVGLHHQHVGVRQPVFRVPGALVVEIV